MVIQYIDQSYFDSYNDPLKDVLIEEFNFELPVTKTSVKYAELDKREKMYLGAAQIIEQLYETFYFHFVPYWSMYYSYYTYNYEDPTDFKVQNQKINEIKN